MNKSDLFDVIVTAEISEGLADPVRISGGVMKVIRYTAYCTAGIYSVDNTKPVSYDDIISNLCDSGIANLIGRNYETKIKFTVEK